jgi:hypothetical protein
MYERFTDRALLAHEEAHFLSNSFIGTEHILLGLVGERKGRGSSSLRASR